MVIHVETDVLLRVSIREHRGVMKTEHKWTIDPENTRQEI